MRVLIVKTSSMGDIIHTLPALTDAANHVANISFDWVVEENFSEIPSWHTSVDKVIPVAIRRWRKSWFSRQTRQERTAFIQALQQHHYDAIIDAQGLIKSALLVARKANGIRHGYDRQSIREPIASWFYDIKHNVSKNLHAIERSRMLFAKSLQYKLPTLTGEHAIVDYFLSQGLNDKQPYFVFLHATTRDYKHWTEEAWRKLMTLIEPTHFKIKLPWGTDLEKQRAERLARGFSHVEVLPKSSLTDMAKVISGAKAVISVDTGLGHLTAALNRPNIMLFAKTDPNLVGGYGENQYTILSNDGEMKSISAEQVYTKINEIVEI